MKNPHRYDQSRFKIGDTVELNRRAASHIESEVRVLAGKRGHVVDVTKNGWIVVDLDGGRHTLEPRLLDKA
jgi:ribosomal protein L21E